MRLQVEIATASAASPDGDDPADQAAGARRRQREALAHVERRGVVRDAGDDDAVHTTALRSTSAAGLGPARSGSAGHLVLEPVELRLEPPELLPDQPDVDQDGDPHQAVGGGDVLDGGLEVRH